MNRAQLVHILAVRLGGERRAAAAVDAVLAEIQAAVARGDRVLLMGFGVFERRVRPARTVRNPRTGGVHRVPQAVVPVFRPGAGFRQSVRTGVAPARRGPTGRSNMEVALGHLGSAGYRLTSASLRNLAMIVDRGEQALAARRTAAIEARRNLVVLLDRAMHLAAERGRTTVDDRMLRAALRGLCPLPPWCRDG
ncbi:nucleoid DNA-binding protein [Allocatelliglobosispora scoriae]|uniref:Nucleoid DNA-binding protein n=1 Tax=Allocatelliglobosispora scoriae TaxID=643052 RepID=A0A841BLF9_9ACTN|nr:HU family DNA-binding protein [Allocatelliglobosispora scoriae]MBB5869124.1 nucleoid DNA-binding protein [Allocatelliglobosispora scoriae]